MASTSSSPAGLFIIFTFLIFQCNLVKLPESWCRKSSLTLIRCYKNHPCLYDSLHPHYLKKDKKEEAYRQIVEKVEAVRPNVTIADVRKRIKTLLGQLHKEKNKHRRTANKGEVYRPKLWCYKELKFLFNRNVQTNKTSTNISGPLLGMKGQSRVEDLNDSLPAGTSATKDTSIKRQRCDSLEEAALATLKAAENAEQNAKAQRHHLTPVEAFSQYLCAEMRQLSQQTFNKLKIDMMELLNDAIVKDQQHETWHRVTDEVPSTSMSSSTITAPVYEISGGMPFKKIKLQKIAIIQPPSGEATYFQL